MGALLLLGAWDAVLGYHATMPNLHRLAFNLGLRLLSFSMPR